MTQKSRKPPYQLLRFSRLLDSVMCQIGFASNMIDLCLKYKKYLLDHVKTKRQGQVLEHAMTAITLEDLEGAWCEIIRHVQRNSFGVLKSRENVNKRSLLYKLDEVFDEKSIVRVGGRLVRSRFSYELQYTVILP